MLEIDTRSLIPISPATLLLDTIAGIDIYASAGKRFEATLFCSKELPVSGIRLRELAEEGVFKLYVGTDSYHAYQEYLRGHWDQIADDPSLSIECRTSILNEVVRDVLNTAFQTGSTPEIVGASQSLGDGIVKMLGDDRVSVKGLYDVLQHDYTTFTHSANVAFYAVLLAKQIGYSLNEQNKIAVGALLHDLGKLSTPERILAKPGRLDEFEFKVIQKHPVVGYQKLASREDLSHAQLMIVYQHHEKLNGTGYPVGLVEDEIHPWAKLCAVVDVFEALTSTRPYRSALDHSIALSILAKAGGTELDAEMVRCWTQLVLQGIDK
jgi:putative nucleotidyltransferase with HDIG domain